MCACCRHTRRRFLNLHTEAFFESTHGVFSVPHHTAHTTPPTHGERRQKEDRERKEKTKERKRKIKRKEEKETREERGEGEKREAKNRVEKRRGDEKEENHEKTD